jgi:hypothetical protein
LANPENFSRNLPGSPDFTRSRKFQAKYPKKKLAKVCSKKLQLSLILRVAGQIWQIPQIPAVICRILQISPDPANSKPKFHSKKLAKVCSQKLQFRIIYRVAVQIWQIP